MDGVKRPEHLNMNILQTASDGTAITSREEEEEYEQQWFTNTIKDLTISSNSNPETDTHVASEKLKKFNIVNLMSLFGIAIKYYGVDETYRVFRKTLHGEEKIHAKKVGKELKVYLKEKYGIDEDMLTDEQALKAHPTYKEIEAYVTKIDEKSKLITQIGTQMIGDSSFSIYLDREMLASYTESELKVLKEIYQSGSDSTIGFLRAYPRLKKDKITIDDNIEEKENTEETQDEGDYWTELHFVNFVTRREHEADAVIQRKYCFEIKLAFDLIKEHNKEVNVQRITRLKKVMLETVKKLSEKPIVQREERGKRKEIDILVPRYRGTLHHKNSFTNDKIVPLIKGRHVEGDVQPPFDVLSAVALGGFITIMSIICWLLT